MNVDEDNYLVDEDDKSEDLQFIIDAVEQEGVGILSPEELSTYVMYAQENMGSAEDLSHYDNLAEDMDKRTLQKMAGEIINWVDWDEESRADWSSRESKGIRLLGVSDETEGGAAFEGASKVVHPLLMEGIVQFQSRAITELWPKAGPVKTQIMGEADDEVREQSERVENYMNYLYTQKMPGAFEETDQMLFRLPLSGSCFKKCYYDPIEDTLCSRLVEPADFIVPYSAVDLRSAPRFTHRLREMRNDVLKKIKLGHYADVHLGRALNEDYEFPVVKEEIDHTEGKDRTQIDDDQRHTILEMYVDYDLEGFEDDDGIALPYIITVNRDDQSILRIQRNWNENDPLKKKRLYFTHYKFTPGFGFYGYGLLHLIGGLGNSATGALRALLDSAQYDNLQGGFKTRDAKIEGGDTPVAPGEWREVSASMDDLKQGFFPLPSKGPSNVLFSLLGYLDERAQRIASTTDAMVGDVPANMPVGTALQNQENGSKVFSAIHGRLHEAQGKEFKIIAELNRDYLPEEGYPYVMAGRSGSIMISDFDDRVDVIPVSDPNLISQSHRIAQAQGVIELAEKFPKLVNAGKAIELMLDAMRVANIDELMTPAESDGMEDKAFQLELAKLQAEIDKLTSAADKDKADTVNKSVESTFSAMSSAEKIAMQPQIVPVADDLLASSGFQDKNGAPIAAPTQQVVPEVPQQMNTNPLTPTNPGVGINTGMETGVQ